MVDNKNEFSFNFVEEPKLEVNTATEKRDFFEFGLEPSPKVKSSTTEDFEVFEAQPKSTVNK